jgi:hypothetical protein
LRGEILLKSHNGLTVNGLRNDFFRFPKGRFSASDSACFCIKQCLFQKPAVAFLKSVSACFHNSLNDNVLAIAAKNGRERFLYAEYSVNAVTVHGYGG